MPRAAVARPGLLDQQVVVEHPDAARAHQRAGDRRQRASRGTACCVLGDPLPVAEVLDERARLAGPVPLMPSGPSSARLRSTPAAQRRDLAPGSSTPRSSTTPSRRKSSTSWGSTAGTGRKTTARRRGPRTARTRRGAAAGGRPGARRRRSRRSRRRRARSGGRARAAEGRSAGGAGAAARGRAGRAGRPRARRGRARGPRRSRPRGAARAPRATAARRPRGRRRRSAAAARSRSPTRRWSCGCLMPRSMDIKRFDIKRTAGPSGPVAQLELRHARRSPALSWGGTCPQSTPATTGTPVPASALRTASSWVNAPEAGACVRPTSTAAAASNQPASRSRQRPRAMSSAGCSDAST